VNFDGVTYGKEGYDELMQQAENLVKTLKAQGGKLTVRPWHFEVDPYRRHSVIAAVGVRFPKEQLCGLLNALKDFLRR
jgi:hypothetical protein